MNRVNQNVRQLDRITCAVINTSNEVKSPLPWEFWIYNFSLIILERALGWKQCKYKEWVSFFLGSWGMNRSAEQTNRLRTTSRFTRFVCPALRFIPHEPRKKDTHSLNNGTRKAFSSRHRHNNLPVTARAWNVVDGEISRNLFIRNNRNHFSELSVC